VAGFVTALHKNLGRCSQAGESRPNDDYSEFGDDAPLMCAVARIAAAVLRPPKV
jgi:hypothetical protein